jgi:hypothetical protein
MAGQYEARIKVGQAGHGTAWRGAARRGRDRVLARQGRARLGMARHGEDRVVARLGEAGQGMAWPGLAWIVGRVDIASNVVAQWRYVTNIT